MAANANAEFRQEAAADRCRCNACRRLPCRRSLEHVPRVFAIVLEETSEVRVAGANARDRAPPGIGVSFAWGGIHHVLPVLPIPVSNEHRDRGAHGLSGA